MLDDALDPVFSFFKCRVCALLVVGAGDVVDFGERERWRESLEKAPSAPTGGAI